MGTVRYKMDLNNPPKMSEEELARIDAIRDEDIDYSDIPETDEEFWKNAKAIDFKALVKKQTTLRLSQNVIEHFKADGRGWQTRINTVLNAYVALAKKR
jgi:uncharacterized protein (DUF4415 family)